jgi:putative nucleotidyltransferase with HDIG domain
MDVELNNRKIAGYIAKMPSLPTTVSKVLEICNNPRTSPVDLNQVISLDPVLMGKVLKLINSAYYGLGQQITSLVRAIIMLGINTVKNLALSTAVLDHMSKSGEFQALNMEGFWRHSLCVGATSRLIAKRRKVDPKIVEEYFAAGLLHDIGKIPLNNALSQDYVTAMAYSDRERISIYAAEKAVIGMDHSMVGASIAKSWKLDEAISDAIAWHHAWREYGGEHKDVLFSVVLANYFANRDEIGFSGNRYPDKLDKELYGHLGLPANFLDEIEEQVASEIEKASVFLKLGAQR